MPNSTFGLSHFRVLGHRASDKQRTLESCSLQNPSQAEIGLSDKELLRWYFEERIGVSLIEDVSSYAIEAGFPDIESFKRAVLREFCYCCIRGQSDSGDTE